jgi:hypothetical protein
MTQPPYFYRIQHAGASDSMLTGVWVLPPSRTLYDPEKGLAPALEMEQPYERRINKEFLENALNPMSKEHTGMIALYDNYGMSFASPSDLCPFSFFALSLRLLE